MSNSPSPAPSPSPLTRRTVVKLVAVTVGGGGLGAGGSALLTRLGEAAPPPYRFFTATEAALIIELCEQIIPRDDVPGATDAGVIHFIDRQLATRLARQRQTYREALPAFAQACRSIEKQPFDQLPANRKIAFLQQVDAGKVPTTVSGGVALAPFFRLLVAHTMQGFYGSPKHGGNRDYVSYRMLGLDQPQVIGRNRHRRA